MRLVTCRDRDRSIKPGVLLSEEIVDIGPGQLHTMKSLIEEGPDALGRLRNFLGQRRVVFRWLRWNCWLRSKIHRAFSVLAWRITVTQTETHREIPKVPTIFLKLTSALNGPRSAVVPPGEAARSSPITKPNSRLSSGRAVRTLPPTHVGGACLRLHDHERCKCARRANGYESVVPEKEFRYVRTPWAGDRHEG